MFVRSVYDKVGDDNIFFLAGAISFNVLVALTFTATCFELLKYVFSWYVTELAQYGSAYGNLITIAVLFFWIYYGVIVFILGGEVAQVWTMRRVVRATRAGSLLRGEL